MGKPRPTKYKPFSRFPLVDRDFSVTVRKDHSMDEIQKKVKKAVGSLFAGMSLKDQYSGKNMNEGEVSLTLNVKFQADDRTLGEDELKVVQKKVLDTLASL